MSELFTRGKKGARGGPEARFNLNALGKGQEIGPFTAATLKPYNVTFCQNGLAATRSVRDGLRMAIYRQGKTKAGKLNARCNASLAKTRWQVRWTADGSMIKRTA